jgi:DNA-binding FadR family transcriptional regulator
MAGVVASDPNLFRPVSVERVSQGIVDQIKALIHGGKLTEGDRLPSERELCQQFDVSRVSVREALRVLEAGGLIEIRVGARGGAVVTSPTNARLGAGLADLVALSRLTPAHVTEARKVIEIAVLPLAVERADADDIATLRRMIADGYDALARDEYTMVLSSAFHVGIAKCAHNPAIESLVESFHGPMLTSMRQAQVAAPAMGRRGTDEHAAIVDAIEARDVAAAVAVMTTHVDRTADLVRGLPA